VRGTLIYLDSSLLKPVSLRSLDAIHLATALSLGREIAGVVAYDERLLEAAVHARLRIWSPGRAT
jgi:uncharacterized protein